MTTEDTYGIRNSLCRWLAAAALAAVSLNAAAFGVDRSAELAWSVTGNKATGSLARGGGGGGPLSTSSMAGGVGVGGSKAMPWPGKSQAENMAKWKTMATSRDLAKGLMNPAGAALTLLGGYLSKQLLDQACVRLMGGQLQSAANGLWEECNFVDRVTNQYIIYNYAGTKSSSPESACAKWPQHRWPINRVVYEAPNGGNGPWGYCYGYMGATYVEGQPIQSAGTETQKVQEGYKPAEAGAVESKITAKLDDWIAADVAAGAQENSITAQGQKVARELLDADAPFEASDTPTLQCPASVEGAPVVTTETQPNGSGGTRTATKTTTNTYHYTSTGNSCVQSMSTKTTTSYSDGTPTEETTTEKTDERSRCEADPRAFGCEDLDLDSAEVPKTTKNVDFLPDNLGFGGGACPAPFGWTDRLGSHTINLAPYCSMIVDIVKPLVLLVAALMALAIAVPGMRGEVAE